MLSFLETSICQMLVGLSADSNFSTLFCNLVFQYNFCQLIEFPHRNILNLIISNCDKLISNIKVYDKISSSLKSDHHMISFKIKQTNPNYYQTKGSFYIHNHSRRDYESLNMYLCNIDFSSCYHSNDVEYTWSFIKSVILSSIEQGVPMVKIEPIKPTTKMVHTYLETLYQVCVHFKERISSITDWK